MYDFREVMFISFFRLRARDIDAVGVLLKIRIFWVGGGFLRNGGITFDIFFFGMVIFGRERVLFVRYGNEIFGDDGGLFSLMWDL